MPDKRRHRGPHPQDAELFDSKHWPKLQNATADLSWLLTRDYSLTAAVKLVGDRYALRQRQRLAVQRSACSDQALADRCARHVGVDELRDADLGIDGFNLLMTVEAALSQAIIIVGRDGCYRDMASVHGTFRLVHETLPALTLIGDHLAVAGPARIVCFLDSPVSNSGRLASRIRQTAADQKWNWDVQLVTDPDAALRKSDLVVVSADSVVLDDCNRWFNAGRRIIEASVGDACLVPMSAQNQPNNLPHPATETDDAAPGGGQGIGDLPAEDQ